MRIHRTLALGAATLVLALSACSPGEGSSPSAAASEPATGDLPEISIGSAGFPEAAVVAEIYAQALEANGFTVDRHLELGERDAVRAAFDSGDINLAPDYLGGLASLLGAEVSPDADATHAAMITALEAEGQTALDYSPGTDADGFVVRQETADELGLATMSDLAEVAGDLVWGLAPGLPGQSRLRTGPERCVRHRHQHHRDRVADAMQRGDRRGAERGCHRRRAGLHHAAGDRELQLRPARGRRRPRAGAEPRARADAGAGRCRRRRAGRHPERRQRSC